MNPAQHALIAIAIVGLAACSDNNDAATADTGAATATQPAAADLAEDRVEQAAERSAAISGTATVALGMTEQQLLDADLVDAGGVELGSVERVMRGPAGKPDRLLIEVEDSNPDRFVYVSLDGLASVRRGTDTDISSALTKDEINALPAVDLTAVR